jgi:hypothetical protein
MTPGVSAVRNCVQHSPPVSTSGPPGAMTAVFHPHGVSLARLAVDRPTSEFTVPDHGGAVPLAVQSDDAVDELGTEVICDEEEIFSAVVRLMNTGVTK